MQSPRHDQESEAIVTPLVEALVDADPGQDLDRILARALVDEGFCEAACVWRQEDQEWIRAFTTGNENDLPPSATVRALLTHGWSHEIGPGAAVIQDGSRALALARVPEPVDDVLDQVLALLTIRTALDEGSDGPTSLVG